MLTRTRMTAMCHGIAGEALPIDLTLFELVVVRSLLAIRSLVAV